MIDGRSVVELIPIDEKPVVALVSTCKVALKLISPVLVAGDEAKE